MKLCCTCRTEKGVADFSKARSCKDGLQSQCKKCDKAYRQIHREERVGINRKYRNSNSEKTQAHNAVNHAVRGGKLKRSVFCEGCGLPAETDGHHADYDELLEVDWLCKKCHIKLHQKIKEFAL